VQRVVIGARREPYDHSGGVRQLRSTDILEPDSVIGAIPWQGHSAFTFEDYDEQDRYILGLCACPDLHYGHGSETPRAVADDLVWRELRGPRQRKRQSWAPNLQGWFGG
jgi:hypothetical protein